MVMIRAYLWYWKRKIFNNKKFTHCSECGHILPHPVRTILPTRGIICDECTLKMLPDSKLCNDPTCFICPFLKQMKQRIELERMKQP